MHAGDAGMNKLAHRTHCVQRLAETGAGIRERRYRDRSGDIAGHSDLLIQCQKRLGSTARAAGDKPADIDCLEPGLLDQPTAERVVGDRGVDESLLGEQPA